MGDKNEPIRNYYRKLLRWRGSTKITTINLDPANLTPFLYFEFPVISKFKLFPLNSPVSHLLLATRSEFDNGKHEDLSRKKQPGRCFLSSPDYSMLRFGGYLLRFHLLSDWSRKQ